MLSASANHTPNLVPVLAFCDSSMVKNKKEEGIMDAVNHKLDDMKFRMILGFLAVLQFAAVFLNSYSHVSFGVQTKISAAAGKYLRNTIRY